jgi:hypothetical protein
MSDLSAAAAALGVPEPIVQRSAAARAAETGMSVDEVLAAWAGGGSVGAPAGGPEPAAPAPVEAGPGQAAAPVVEETAPAPVPAATAPAEAAMAAPPPPGPVTRSPIPAEVTPAQAAGLPEVITVPTAGIRERTNLAIPRWLTAVILIIPAFALIALGGSATGECGEATQLQTDVVTGEIVNCDGSEFTGSGPGGGGADFIAEGEALYAAAPGNCTGCHGATGGGGVGPAFSGVLTTFGACADHIEWVRLGSQGFRDAGESTYGDSNKPINGGMPSFGSSLSEEQLASVVAFERVRFGGADPAQVLTDCGLAPAEGEAGEQPAEGGPGEPPGEGGGTTTTVAGASTTAGG